MTVLGCAGEGWQGLILVYVVKTDEKLIRNILRRYAAISFVTDTKNCIVLFDHGFHCLMNEFRISRAERGRTKNAVYL